MHHVSRCVTTMFALGLAVSYPAHATTRPDAWVTVMQDGFDTLDAGHWNYWAGDIVQGGSATYTYLPANVFTSAGSLAMRATRDTSRSPIYQSGGVFYPRYFQYGRFSARVRMTGTPGMIPGIWLSSYAPRCGEIDIFEATGLRAYDPHKIHSQHYYFDDPANCETAKGQENLTSLEWTGDDDYSAAFHVFTLDWSPDAVTYSVDGVQKFASTYRVPVVPMQLRMETNLEPVMQGGITNIINAATVFPADFLVDWVKVEQFAPPACGATGDHTGNLRNPDGRCARVLAASFNGDGTGDAILYDPSTGDAAIASGQPAPGTGVVALGISPGWPSNAKVITGDFNGDGFSDAAVYAPDGSLSLHYGQKDATFRDTRTGAEHWNQGLDLHGGDFNGDGFSDLLVYNPVTGDVEIRYGSASDGLRFAPLSQGRWAAGEVVTIGDFNGDRRDDIFLYGSSGDVEIVYGQDADGVRAAPSSRTRFSLGWHFSVGDFNGDDRADLLVYSPTTGDLEIRYGQDADGLRFAPATQDRWNRGHILRTGDFNGDGFDDVLVYGQSGSIEIRYGQTQDGLRFAPASQALWSPGHRLSIADFDGDGRSDVFVQSSDGSVEIRYGQPSDGLRFAASTQGRWNSGWQIISGRQ